MLKIPMQFFADEVVEDSNTSEIDNNTNTNANETEQPKGETAPKPEGKTFSQEEVNKIISERLSRQKEQFEKEKAEAAKLAKMNAEQKEQYAKQKREEELTAREKAVTIRELKAESKNILAERKLPVSLSEILDYSSAESCKASIDAVEKAFSEAVSSAVDARLRNNNVPKKSDGNTAKDPFLEGLGL